MEVLQQWRRQEIKGSFIDFLKIESDVEFLLSLGTFFQS